jgi:hypothetical protein
LTSDCGIGYSIGITPREVTAMFNPYPTVPVYSQVGWAYNGTLYCNLHEPEPYLQRTHGDLVQPVLRCDLDTEEVCDDCGEALD